MSSFFDRFATLFYVHIRSVCTVLRAIVESKPDRSLAILELLDIFVLFSLSNFGNVTLLQDQRNESSQEGSSTATCVFLVWC